MSIFIQFHETKMVTLHSSYIYMNIYKNLKKIKKQTQITCQNKSYHCHSKKFPHTHPRSLFKKKKKLIFPP